MGNIGFVALKDIGLALRDGVGLSVFIETGTYKGLTTRWASENFKKVTTIEASPHFYNRAKKIFADAKNVKVVFGDSGQELGKVLKRLKKPALIYLDAHKCSHEESVSEVECPLLDELDAIAATGIDHIVLIDDARMFMREIREGYDPAQWPKLDEVKAKFPGHYEVAIWNDVIFAVPPVAMPIIKRFTQQAEMEVICLTSNNYIPCIPPFAYLFNKFWDAGQPVKVVRYDIRPPRTSGNFSHFAIGRQADYTWSSGLIKYLNHHNEPLIVLMLEDYFIDRPVNKKAIAGLWDLMRKDASIAKIDLTDDRLKVDHTKFNNELIRSDDNAPFQTSLQAAIWRKDFLLQFLDPSEDAWQFEKHGTRRIIEARKQGKFNGIILGCQKPPLSYVNAKGGEGTQPDLWDFKKIPEWMVKELRTRGLM